MALAQDASPSNHPSRHPATSSSVVTTSILQTTRLADGKKMINQYVMDAKVGSGQHGHVWRCYENKYYLALDERRVLAMKIVKRDNPKARRDRQYKMLRMRANNNSNGSGSGSGGGGLGGNRPRSNPTVVDGIRTAEQEIRKEIAIMKKCRHPHVVRLYEVIDDRKNEMVFMVMEYLGGGEIQYTSPSSPGKPILTVEQTRRIMRDAILGLEYLHHQGIIHRDIKPANLLWSTGHERVKIADFGTAHFSYAQRLAAAKTSNSQMADDTEEDPLLLNDADLAKRAGSPAFLAPEIVWEFTEWEEARLFYPSWWALSETPPPRPPVTKSIDIWALGVTLYCLLFGKIPFCPPPERGSSVDVTANGHSNGEQPDGGQSSNANVNVTEWVMYRYICNKDWRAERRMGRDGVFTGGRDAGDQMTREMEKEENEEPGVEGGEEERVQGRTEAKTSENGSREGSLVMHLLDHFLQKDLNTRITLEEVKMNPWFLHDLPNPDFWLRMTSPNEIDSGSRVAESMTTTTTTVNVDVNVDSASSLSSSTSPATTSGSSILGVSTASTTTTATSPIEANVLVASSSSSAAGIEIGTDGDIFSGSYTFSQTTTNPSTNTQTHTHTHVIVPAATASTSAPAFHPNLDEDGLGALTKIEVTEKEREDAMSVLKFRWRVGGGSGGAGGNGGSTGAKGQGKGSFSRISSRITSFFRGGNTDKSKTRAKSGRETKKNDSGLRDRGPVTSEPNLRLKAIRAEHVERVPREMKRSGRERSGRERSGRDGRDKSKARRKLEKAVTETAGSSYLATGSREFKEQTRSARPTMSSAPEKEKRGRDLDRDVDESDERTPRMGGTRQLQSVSLPSATPRFSSAGASTSVSMTQAQTRRREDKGKGKQKAVDVDVDSSHPSSSPRSPARFLSRSISRSRSARRSRSRNSTSGTATVKVVGRGSVTTPTTITTAAAMSPTTTTNHPSPTISPMGRIFSSLSSGWKRSESVVSLGLGLHNRSFSSISGIRQAGTATGGEGTTAMTSQSAPGSGAGSPSATSSMLYLRQDVVTRSSPPTPIESSTSSPTSPLSSTVRRPRPVHAVTQPSPPIVGRAHSRSQSQSKFFVHTSDEDDLGDEFQSDDDDDVSSSILSDEILHYRRTSSWDQEHRGGHHPPELESLHPEPEPFLSPVSPISFSRGTRNEYEYDADINYDYEDDEDDDDGLNLDEDPGVNPGTVSRASVPRTPRRRGWDALSDGDVEDVDVMSNLDMSDAEEGEGGGRRGGEEDEGLVILFGKRKTEGKSSP